MKSLKTYLPSLILSVLLVFSMIGTSALIVAESYASPERLAELSQEHEIVPKIKTELSNYFGDKYNETGIPAEIYTSALTDEYIAKIVEININAAFSRLDGGTFNNTAGRENPALEESITAFFNSYADDNGYAKDEKFNSKLSATIDSAYSVITDYCDIYKFRTMNNEGILGKVSGIYQSLDKLVLAAAAVTLILLAIIVIINIKAISAALYWSGITALVSGIIGIIPCIYLSSTNYFDAFVIKQPHIFTSFTGLMYDAVDSFMTNQIILLAAGVVMLIIFAVVPKKAK